MSTEYECVALTHELDVGSSKLTITGTGAGCDYESPDLVPWKDYATSATSVEIASGITAIGDYMFYGFEPSVYHQYTIHSC